MNWLGRTNQIATNCKYIYLWVICPLTPRAIEYCKIISKGFIYLSKPKAVFSLIVSFTRPISRLVRRDKQNSWFKILAAWLEERGDEGDNQRKISFWLNGSFVNNLTKDMFFFLKSFLYSRKLNLNHDSFCRDNFLAIWTSVNYIFEIVDAKRD